jgi:hypothetical protein
VECYYAICVAWGISIWGGGVATGGGRSPGPIIIFIIIGKKTLAIVHTCTCIHEILGEAS